MKYHKKILIFLLYFFSLSYTCKNNSKNSEVPDNKAKVIRTKIETPTNITNMIYTDNHKTTNFKNYELSQIGCIYKIIVETDIDIREKVNFPIIEFEADKKDIKGVKITPIGFVEGSGNTFYKKFKVNQEAPKNTSTTKPIIIQLTAKSKTQNNDQYIINKDFKIKILINQT